jgi:hypothetical protein
MMPGSKDNLQCMVAFHNNRCVQYELDLEHGHKEKSVLGSLTTHEMAIRGVAISPSDSIFATHSFDCLKVWSVDLYQSNKKGELTIECR